MKALFKIQRAGKTARPLLRYVLTLKAKQRSAMDKDARVGDVLVSDDLKHLQSDLQDGDSNAITAASKQIESHTRTWACNKHRHRDHFTISAPAGMSHKLFKQLAVKAMPELATAMKLCSYVAVLHKDCKHPHLHIVADAYAPSIGKGIRRHVSKDKLAKLIDMSWTKHFQPPSPGLGAERSERGKTILRESFKNTSKAKVDLAAQVYKALGGKVLNVEDAVKILSKKKIAGTTTDFHTAKNTIKASASIVASDGTKLRLSHIVKCSDLYKNTKQFKAVDASLVKKAVKTTYTFAAPAPVKAVLGGAKEVLKVFKQASAALIPDSSATAPAAPMEAVAPAPAPSKKKDRTKEIEAYMNSTDESTGLKIHELAEKAKKAAAKEKAEKEKKREALLARSKERAKRKRKFRFKKSDPNL